MKSKEYIKDKVLCLHYEGLSNKDISLALNITLSTVFVMIKKYTKRNKLPNDYFNVDELECWIFPSKSKSINYDSRKNEKSKKRS